MKKFNKKSFITLCAVALMACVCVFTAACTPDVDEITEFAEKIENADSMEVVMTMSVPMIGDVEYTMKYDDNKAYTSAVMGSPAQFVEYVNDEMYYTYTESANGWVKEGPMRGSDGTGRRLSTSTVNLIITVMQSSLKCAFIAGKTATYAADNVKRPRVIERDTQCFTSREQAAIEGEILRYGRTNLYGIIICLYTGLRIGELLALRWEDIDFRRNLLYVNRTGHDGRDVDGNYVLICNSPKTASSKRCIPLSRQMAKLLRGIRERSGGEYVISNKSKPVLVRSYQRSFERLLKKLNIPRRGFHALRHTFATRAVECGMDIKMLSEILGHKSPAVTLNRYVHSFMDGKRKMMNRLGEVCLDDSVQLM